MSLDSVLAKIQTSVPQCVAVGCVDMVTGMLLGVKTVDSHPQEVLDLVAAATSDLYQGPNVANIEAMFRKSRGVKEDGHHYFQEIMVISENLLHLFQRCKRNDQLVLCVVCRVSANMGMVLTKSRGLLSEVEASI